MQWKWPFLELQTTTVLAFKCLGRAFRRLHAYGRDTHRMWQPRQEGRNAINVEIDTVLFFFNSLMVPLVPPRASQGCCWRKVWKALIVAILFKMICLHHKDFFWCVVYCSSLTCLALHFEPPAFVWGKQMKACSGRFAWVNYSKGSITVQFGTFLSSRSTVCGAIHDLATLSWAKEEIRLLFLFEKYRAVGRVVTGWQE